MKNSDLLIQLEINGMKEAMLFLDLSGMHKEARKLEEKIKELEKEKKKK